MSIQQHSTCNHFLLVARLLRWLRKVQFLSSRSPFFTPCARYNALRFVFAHKWSPEILFYDETITSCLLNLLMASPAPNRILLFKYRAPETLGREKIDVNFPLLSLSLSPSTPAPNLHSQNSFPVARVVFLSRRAGFVGSWFFVFVVLTSTGSEKSKSRPNGPWYLSREMHWQLWLGLPASVMS